MSIFVNLAKAKSIVHDKRRAARSAEFAPLDIKATIPAESKAAEAARALVRERHNVIQGEIDACERVEELKSIMEKL